MVRYIIALTFLLCTLSIVADAEETFENDYFRLVYGDEGLTSLKRHNDKYDTDYIAEGNNLGPLRIRYRASSGGDWSTTEVVSKAASDEVGEAGYLLGGIVPTIASSSQISASRRSRGVENVCDQIEPKDSSDWGAGAFTWRDGDGTEEWLQYDFAESRTVSFVSVYWFLSESRRFTCKLPASWRLLYKEGEEWKDVNNIDPYGVEKDVYNRVSFAPVVTNALKLLVQLQAGATAGVLEWRVETDEGRKAEATKGLLATEEFRPDGDSLVWSMTLRNTGDEPLEIGDLALRLPFNTRYDWDRTTTYTKRVIKHQLVSGHGSFVYWMRTNAEGPYLVMVPVGNTKLEYCDYGDEGFMPYIHSKSTVEEMYEKGGNWRLPATSLALTPRGSDGDAVDYAFKFRWAEDLNGVREVLYEEGGFDVEVVPGMTVPEDLFAMFSVRTENDIRSIVPEYPEATEIEETTTTGSWAVDRDTRIYKVKFARLGENTLTINYDDNRYMVLEFFVTEPVETLMKKRAHFLIKHQQHRNSKKWYNGLVCDWDMKNKVLRNPEDNKDGFEGFMNYVLTCDDPGLCKVPYAASKNVVYPVKEEIEGIEYYLKNYVWGGLQCTEEEKYPYAIYGVPNWKVNRDSSDPGRNGREHLWRIYDYSHIVLLYYRMYEIAEYYPEMTHYLDASGYLDRAYGTAMAFFTVPLTIENWSAYKTGTYNELIIPDVIDALYAEGKKDKADALRGHWEKKVDYFINDQPYLFGSEYPFDTTGFESTHAFAKYALKQLGNPEATLKVTEEGVERFIDEEIRLNVACRGWLETAYYFLGSDYRAESLRYTLSYMAQMGGWSIMDYALYNSDDPVRWLRLGYASYLSSWALMNSGTKESNYGYWYPGKENDGAAGGGFEPRAYTRNWLNKEQPRGCWAYGCEIDLGYSGAVRAAATVVVDDPLFGLFAYGGLLEVKDGTIEVVPKDGLRRRFHVVRGDRRLHLLLDRDRFAPDKPIIVSDDLSEISFRLEDAGGRNHTSNLRVGGLPKGSYSIYINKKQSKKVFTVEEENKEIVFPIEVKKSQSILIKRS